MPQISLKPTHKVVRAYYEALHQLGQLRLDSEGNVAPAFATLLGHCARQVNWTLAEQFALHQRSGLIRVDGALLDEYRLVHGIWEAKDSADDLVREVQRKFARGYPRENTLFQAPARAILWQDGRQVMDTSLQEPEALVEVLQTFFAYQPPAYEAWERAVGEFKERIPQLAAGLLALIEQERRGNRTFIEAFEAFTSLVRDAINPNISVQAVEEMLIQHLLTERLFRRVFDNPDFVHQNIIAHEIEEVIRALTSRKWNRSEFLAGLDRFYGAIEMTAATIDDFAQKQDFLNTVYEKFFQGFSVKVADTHGIVYTPQPIVEFMVRSVEELLQREFGRRLGDADVHILDPFVGTGNFLLRVMQAMPRTRLAQKYGSELHCNEVMLLPYYIASMNIEHLFYELTGEYKPFEGICLVDTFELAEGRQMRLLVAENTERVLKQQEQDIFIILGNPPYNAGQVNENDNNKNRKYPMLDERIAETYVKASQATLNTTLYDPYVKAFRWASDRIGEEGVIAFVTNNSFLDGLAFDGMRKHLEQEFDAIYLLDLGGNVRKNPKLSGTTHNVFGIQVGVSIAFLVRRKGDAGQRQAEIFYARSDEEWRKEEKYRFLERFPPLEQAAWQRIEPNANHTWLTEGLQSEFEDFLPMGSKEGKSAKRGEAETIFKVYSRGIASNNDAYVYNFDEAQLAATARAMVESYEAVRDQWLRKGGPKSLDGILKVDEKVLKWIRNSKRSLLRGEEVTFDPANIRRAMYRPFSSQYHYFERAFNEDIYRFPSFFPTPETENLVIIVSDRGYRSSFSVLMTDRLPDLHALAAVDAFQCFPLYTYDEDGGNRRENITDWALHQFREQYGDESIGKLDVFHYVYALLHHPAYRERYAANLRRELPRLPLAPTFWPFAHAGERLAHLHVHYEAQPEYSLQWLENPDAPLDWRVEKMRLSKDKRELRYNEFLTLAGIPERAFAYRLGNRSALEWVIDQYRVHTDKRSGIRNDPNRADDPQAILRLIGQVITVSVETVGIVEGLPGLGVSV